MSLLFAHMGLGQADAGGGGSPTISYVGGASDKYTSGGDTADPGFAAGWAAGDIAIASFVMRGNDSQADPSGWTKIGETSRGTSSSDARLATWYRVLQGGDTAPTFTDPFNTGCARIDIFRADSGTIEVKANASNNGLGTTVTFGALTANSTGEQVLLIGATAADTPTGQLSGSVSHAGLASVSAVDADNISTGTGDGCGVFGAHGAPAASGDTGTGSATLAGSQAWAAYSILIGTA